MKMSWMKIKAVVAVSILIIVGVSSVFAVTTPIVRNNKETISGGTYFYEGNYDFISGSYFNLSKKIVSSNGYVLNVTGANIVTALASSPAKGVISLSPGRYNITSLSISNEIDLIGSCYGDTILNVTGVISNCIAIYNNSCIKNIILEGNGKGDFGIHVDGDNVQVENCRVNNVTADGIIVGRSGYSISNITISHCSLKNVGLARGSGIEVYMGAYNVFIDHIFCHGFSDGVIDIHDHIGEHSPHHVTVDNVIGEFGYDGDTTGNERPLSIYSLKGSYTHQVNNITVSNCVFSFFNASGIYLKEVANVELINIVVSPGRNTTNYEKCYIANVSGHLTNIHVDCVSKFYIGTGFYVTGVCNVSFIGCTVENIGNYGMYILANNVKVIGCTFKVIGGYSTNGYGIRLSGKHVLIIGNTFNTIRRYGIWVDTTGSGDVSLNSFSSMTLGELYDVYGGTPNDMLRMNITFNQGYRYNTLMPFYNQSSAPTMLDNTWAFWYNNVRNYMYLVCRVNNTQFYVNWTTVI